MENVNCLRCRFRHEDNGNCTAVGGFCTAVPAAYCPLLREYLDTEPTPEEITAMKRTLDEYHKVADPLLRAQADGRLVVLPCKVGDTVYTLRRTFDGADAVGETELWWDDIPILGKTVFLTRKEAEKALEAMKNE